MIKKVFLITIIILASIFIFREIFIYTTFQEAVADQLNKNTQIEHVTFYTAHVDSTDKRIEGITIEDQERISQILDNFEGMELKKISTHKHRMYSLSIAFTNKVADNHNYIQTLNLEFDDNFIKITNISKGGSQDFKILSDTDHLNAIQSLMDIDNTGDH